MDEIIPNESIPLTDLQISKIESFCKDKEMFEAVRTVLLAGIYTHGTIQRGYIPDPLVNGAFGLASLALSNPIPDEILGQHIRAEWAGINALRNALERIKKIKSKDNKPIESPYNEAV